MFRIIALPAAVLLAASVAATAEPASQVPANPNGQVVVKDKKICRADTRATGSIMPKRICHTQSEWNALTAQAKSDLEKVRNIELQRQQVGIQR